jgi:hypothetical protein
MNKIQLAQRLRQECGVSGTGPISTLNQTGEMKRLVDWIDQSHLEIQEKRPNWNWMVQPFSFQTVVAQYEYTPTEAGIATTFANWKMDSMRTFLTSSGVGTEQFLSPMAYRDYRDYYLFSTRRTSLAQPLQVSVAPNKNLLLGSPPVDVYTCHGEYYTLPYEMTADTDIPNIPARFHMIIVYRAMMDYGMYEAAPEVVQRGQAGYDLMMKKLEDDQLMDIDLAGPIA